MGGRTRQDGGGDGERRALPARSSRGTRIHKLLGEEAEADAAFWGQAAWQEDESDGDYSTEEEEEDVVDADFDDEEAPDEDVHDEQEDERPKRKRAAQPRARAYREPTARGKRARVEARVAAAGGGTEVVVERPKEQQQQQLKKEAAATPAQLPTFEGPRVRRSTVRKSTEASELRRRASEEAARIAAKTKKPPVDKASARLTQAQLLAEAVRVEVENTQSLNRLEQLEEEKKAEASAPKAPFTGQMVRFYSRIGTPKTVTFLNTNEFPSIFNQPKPKKRVATQIKLEQARREAEEEQFTDENDGSVDGDDDHAEPVSTSKKLKAVRGRSVSNSSVA